MSLSLGSDTVMELRRGEDHRPLLLPRRSLLVLGGESRCGGGQGGASNCELQVWLHFPLGWLEGVRFRVCLEVLLQVLRVQLLNSLLHSWVPRYLLVLVLDELVRPRTALYCSPAGTRGSTTSRTASSTSWARWSLDQGSKGKSLGRAKGRRMSGALGSKQGRTAAVLQACPVRAALPRV